jgi:hypothetical protein
VLVMHRLAPCRLVTFGSFKHMPGGSIQRREPNPPLPSSGEGLGEGQLVS